MHIRDWRRLTIIPPYLRERPRGQFNAVAQGVRHGQRLVEAAVRPPCASRQMYDAKQALGLVRHSRGDRMFHEGGSDFSSLPMAA
jgi:hypothetical protein